MLRLILGILLFLFSLLTLFKAPTNFLWKVALAVTEFPYLPIALSLIVFVSCFRMGSYKLPTLLLSGLSLVLCFLPVTRAYTKGAIVSEDLAKIFPPTDVPQGLERPYSFFKMFSGIGVEKISPRSLVYKQFSGTSLTLDFYASKQAIRAPCIVVIHGGSWAAGDSKQLPELNSYLANRGYQVAAINYRLAPDYKSPAQVMDTRDAIRYLKRESETLKIDTTRFIILGRSAGAQIALVATYSLNDPDIQGVISLYGPADMVWGGRIKVNKWVLNTDKVFDDYLGGSIDQVPEKFKESSACAYVTKASAPTLIIHGTLDALVSFEHSVRLDKKLRNAGVKHYFLDLPGATHGCDFNINGPSGQLSTYAIERFLNSIVPH